MDLFEGTWLVEGPRAALELIGAWSWVLVPLLIVGAFGLFSLRYVAKGGGQYGIIEGYVGTIGAGKTTLAVQHALMLARARNAVLLSNIPLVCGKGCKADRHEIEHALLPMTDEGVDLGDLTRRAFALRDEGRGLVLLMDEVGVVMPARLWKDFSVALMWLLQQSRKLACEWIWTAQDASFVDHQLRTLTAVVHYVRAYPPPSVWRRVKGKRPWLMLASAYTPTNAPRANGETTGRVDKRIGRRIVRYRRAWEASFDTDGVVLPSRHLKGAQTLIAAVGRVDAHVIQSQASDFGVPVGGALDPDEDAVAA